MSRFLRRTPRRDEVIAPFVVEKKGSEFGWIALINLGFNQFSQTLQLKAKKKGDQVKAKTTDIHLKMDSRPRYLGEELTMMKFTTAEDDEAYSDGNDPILLVNGAIKVTELDSPSLRHPQQNRSTRSLGKVQKPLSLASCGR
ncbi:hypothetical protein CDAR_190831 [Caerostris darwini]|uniref:Uncharacterized protein n=1 Tax=Caerostris darwini TaxID=1538125 RepID=A0AAV4VCI2_9ARAC|nr:hypothetical protein CDAR_190831 [Caerostris darwini]